jgi:hypothetical protein
MLGKEDIKTKTPKSQKQGKERRSIEPGATKGLKHSKRQMKT